MAAAPRAVRVNSRYSQRHPWWHSPSEAKPRHRPSIDSKPGAPLD